MVVDEYDKDMIAKFVEAQHYIKWDKFKGIRITEMEIWSSYQYGFTVLGEVGKLVL